MKISALSPQKKIDAVMNDIYSKMVKKNTLSSPKRRLKIFQIVVAAHLAVIFLPLSYFLLTDYLSKFKKKDVVVVRLVEIPKEVTKKTVKKSGTRRRVNKPKKKTVRKKTAPKPAPGKRAVEPKFNKPVRKAVKKTVNKTPVRKSVSAARKPVAVKRKYVPPSPPDDLEVIRPDDLKRVPVENNETPDTDDDEVGATYMEQLVGVFYKLWNPPSSQLLNGRVPRVYIKVRFNRYGRVLEAKITRKSGFLPMDRSVQELLRNLKQVPAPPAGEPNEIEFVLVPQE